MLSHGLISSSAKMSKKCQRTSSYQSYLQIPGGGNFRLPYKQRDQGPFSSSSYQSPPILKYIYTTRLGPYISPLYPPLPIGGISRTGFSGSGQFILALTSIYGVPLGWYKGGIAGNFSCFRAI